MSEGYQTEDALEIMDHALSSYPEVFRVPETQIREVPCRLVNRVSQVRSQDNPEQRRLANSIAAHGQKNPINATIVPKPVMAEYLKFTNKVWSTKKRMKSLVPFDESGDLFLLCMAGHSRVLAIEMGPEHLDQKPLDPTVLVNLEPVTSVQQIIDTQYAENIHAAVHTDREARIYAEGYLWELNKNPDTNMTEFCRDRGINRDQLRDFLRYADMPASIRRLCDNGALPFSIARQMARNVEWIEKDHRRLILHERSEDEWTEEDQIKLDSAIDAELLFYVAMRSRGDKVAAVNARIKSDRKAIKSNLGESVAEDNFGMALFDATPYTDRRQHLRRQTEVILREFKHTMDRDQIGLHNAVVELAELDGDLSLDPEEFEATFKLGNSAVAAA